MLSYKILSMLAAFGFLCNIVMLLRLVYKYDFPNLMGRYIFFSLITQMIGLVTQFYCFMQPTDDWWIKALSMTACLQGTVFVIDTTLKFSPLKQYTFMSILSWIQNGFREIPAHLKHYAAVGLEYSKKVEGWLNSPTANLVTALIPGNIDDEAKKELISFAQLIAKICEDAKTIGATDEQTKLVQNALLLKAQSYATQLQDGKELKENEYDVVAQKVYSNTK